MRIYSKICTSIRGRVNASDKSLEDAPSIVTKAFPHASRWTKIRSFWVISTSSMLEEDSEEAGDCEGRSNRSTCKSLFVNL